MQLKIDLKFSNPKRASFLLKRSLFFYITNTILPCKIKKHWVKAHFDLLHILLLPLESFIYEERSQSETPLTPYIGVKGYLFKKMNL